MATFKRGNRVQEVAEPHRKGTVTLVVHPGPYARITVNLDSWHPATFSTYQLRLL